MRGPLISVDELNALRAVRAVVVVDCRFDLAAPNAGEAAYLRGHLPGAVYAHLERDLSGPPVTDHGRHPLPSATRLCAVFGALGIHPRVPVVAYDDMGGGLAAARLWWLLRYMGHPSMAVLDGGWQAWLAWQAACGVAAGAEESGSRVAAQATYVGLPRLDRRLLLDELEPQMTLLDARDPARFRGESEPIDPRAGHIPGAHNHFWRQNLTEDGSFRSPVELRKAFAASLGTLPDGATVHYCGSGVSACHNVLAQVLAGLPEPRLYCGSWSEWCREPTRPAALGTEA